MQLYVEKCVPSSVSAENIVGQSWLDENIFNWIVETGLKDILSCVTNNNKHTSTD